MNVTQPWLPAGLQFDPLLFSGVRLGGGGGSICRSSTTTASLRWTACERDILLGTSRPFECSYFLVQIYDSLSSCQCLLLWNKPDTVTLWSCRLRDKTVLVHCHLVCRGQNRPVIAGRYHTVSLYLFQCEVVLIFHASRSTDTHRSRCLRHLTRHIPKLLTWCGKVERNVA